MIGMIHVVLFDLIEQIGGEQKVKEVLNHAGLDENTTFNIGTVYSDKEWRTIFQATQQVLNITEQQANEAYAIAFIKDAKKRWPKWFEMSKNSMSFIKKQPKIHNGFAIGLRHQSDRKKIQKKFHFEEHGNTIIVHYKSSNKHCGIFKSLANQLAIEYQDTISISESTCMLNNDQQCTIEVTWHSIKNQQGD